jgi:hypothetical protein
MKLRTTQNSIRLRLSQTDIRNFAENGVVDETVQIGPVSEAAFSFRLHRSETIDRTSASYQNNCLTISIPSGIADQWSTSEDVSIKASQPTSDAAELSILIEKDFACLTPRTGDDDKDAFPNPAAAHG